MSNMGFLCLTLMCNDFPQDMVKDATSQKYVTSLKKNTCNQNQAAIITSYVNYSIMVTVIYLVIYERHTIDAIYVYIIDIYVCIIYLKSLN